MVWAAFTLALLRCSEFTDTEVHAPGFFTNLLISVQVIDFVMSTSGYFRMEIFVYAFDFYASSSK